MREDGVPEGFFPREGLGWDYKFQEGWGGGNGGSGYDGDMPGEMGPPNLRDWGRGLESNVPRPGAEPRHLTWPSPIPPL